MKKMEISLSIISTVENKIVALLNNNKHLNYMEENLSLNEDVQYENFLIEGA